MTSAGSSAFTRMPYGSNSAAHSRVSERMAPFAAAQLLAGSKSAQISPQDAPNFCSSARNCSPASQSLSNTTGIAPSRAQARVMAAPMPFAPPVIRITLPLSCKSMVRRFQSIKTGGIAAKDFFLIRLREHFDVMVDELLHLAVRRGQQTHRPIGAEHQSISAERAKYDVKVGLEIIGFPVPPIRFSDQAGNFAEYVFVLRDFSHLRCPGRSFCGFYLRLCHMVDDEALFREAFYKINGCGQLSWIDENVVGKTKCVQLGDTFYKLLASEEAVIRLCLRDVAKAAQL